MKKYNLIFAITLLITMCCNYSKSFSQASSAAAANLNVGVLDYLGWANAGTLTNPSLDIKTETNLPIYLHTNTTAGLYTNIRQSILGGYNSGRGLIGFGDCGTSGALTFTPQSLTHSHRTGNTDVFHQFTNGNTAATSDQLGFQVGIRYLPAAGFGAVYPINTTAPPYSIAELRQWKDAPMDFHTMDDQGNMSQRIRISYGHGCDHSGSNYNPLSSLGATKVLISHKGTDGGCGNCNGFGDMTQAVAMLNLGENHRSFLISGTVTNPYMAGARPWMDVGTFYNFDTDNMYTGLKDNGTNHKDAVINWGDDMGSSSTSERLLVVFTSVSGGGKSDQLEGLEMARFSSPNGSFGRMGIGGDPYSWNSSQTANKYNNCGSDVIDPQNTLEVNSPALFTYPNNDPGAQGTGFSGVRLTDLRASCTPYATNPGPGVLALDECGDIIYVPDAAANGIGLCTPFGTGLTNLPYFGGWNLNSSNFYFDGQYDNSNLTSYDAVGIGYGCTVALPGKLSVDQTWGVGGNLVNGNTLAGFFHNGDEANTTVGLEKTGVYGISDGTYDDVDDGLNIGGDFEGLNCSGRNIGVRGRACRNNNTNINPNLAVGGWFEATDGQSANNYGVNIVTSGSTSTNVGEVIRVNGSAGNTAFGIDALANSATSTNIGVITDGSGGSTMNYGVYATGGSGCTSGSCFGAAGYFGGPIYSTVALVVSDINLKENIKPLENAKDIINQLHPKSYTFKTNDYPSMNLPNGNQDGLIAQEVETILPNLVQKLKSLPPRDSTGQFSKTIPGVEFKALNYTGLIPILIQGMKEQQQTIDSVKTENQQQQQIIDDLNSRLSQLEGIVSGCCTGGRTGSTPLGPTSPNNSPVQAIEVQLSNENSIILNQNDPNPFTEQTTISFSIPTDVKEAKIIFFDNLGRVLKTVVVSERGSGAINVFASNLSAGIYSYSLLTDGNVVSTKKMVKN